MMFPYGMNFHARIIRLVRTRKVPVEAKRIASLLPAVIASSSRATIQKIHPATKIIQIPL
jgi:hypothetical protein